MTKLHITMDSAQEKINNALKVLKFVVSRQTWLRGITQDVELWNEHCHSQPIPVQFLSTQLSIWKSGANFPHSGMPVQNELCGILIEDFLSIWKFRAVFLSGMLAILSEGVRDPGVLEMMGANSYLSGILVFAFSASW
ncbi:hypothetical protein ACET9Q_10675 [Aeromonas caviae]|uniref:hypothetical protein n=1 Tax=Aeromonas TaxID=642 RepID=UPI00214ED6DA|nr:MULTISPECIES: hypothetical protein [Aeromonas]MCR3895353.1 hypothetical protein [Aeromonas caviae]